MAGDGRGPAEIAYRRSFEAPDEIAASGRPDGATDGGPAEPPDVIHSERASESHGDRVRAAEKSLRAALLEVRSSELDRGVCLAGPHRDELELSIRDLPARGYASHGESWSLALALRLASFDLLRSGREDPVLILDDVFAELDAGRRERLAALVATAEQVLVTAAVPADVPGILTGRALHRLGRRAHFARRPARCALTPNAPGWRPRRWPARERTPGRGATAPAAAGGHASKIKIRMSNGPGRLPRARNQPPGRPDLDATTPSPSTPPSAACCRPGAGASG